ncbi:MAG TPA: hypothetical protein VF633_02775 [Brevundimonas sp.]|jgi:hypothetical protein
MAQPLPQTSNAEDPVAREHRLAWERERLAEAEADLVAGNYIEGDEAIRWLKDELAWARSSADREA